jgi:hypothetical protein
MKDFNSFKNEPEESNQENNIDSFHLSKDYEGLLWLDDLGANVESSLDDTFDFQEDSPEFTDDNFLHTYTY